MQEMQDLHAEASPSLLSPMMEELSDHDWDAVALYRKSAHPCTELRFEEKADGGGEVDPSGTEVISCLGFKCS